MIIWKFFFNVYTNFSDSEHEKRKYGNKVSSGTAINFCILPNFLVILIKSFAILEKLVAVPD